MSRRVGVTFRFENRLPAYEEAMRAAGLEPVRVKPGGAAPVESYAGLLLTGGTDIDPALYGRMPHPATDPPDRERDEMELALLNDALERDLPVLAICRGMQLFNIAHPGGTLAQDIPGHRVRSSDPSVPAHAVAIEPGTRLEAIIGSRAAMVNSRHHQAIDRPGGGLVVTATAPDRVIEALERPDRRFAIAVQWHPEDQIRAAPEQLRIFQAFAAAIGE